MEGQTAEIRLKFNRKVAKPLKTGIQGQWVIGHIKNIC
jgi:hypothetical protein